MNKKKILVVSAVFPPEPVTSATLNYDLTLALSKEFDVTVINPRPSRPKGFDFKNTPAVDTNTFHQIVTDTYVQQIVILGKDAGKYKFRECFCKIYKETS